MKIFGRKKESKVESTFANLGQATLQTDEKRSRKEIKKEVREEHSSEGRKNVIGWFEDKENAQLNWNGA